MGVLQTNPKHPLKKKTLKKTKKIFKNDPKKLAAFTHFQHPVTQSGDTALQG
ncbi:hypothetical protein HpBT0302_03470 [Helicobacter pylori]